MGRLPSHSCADRVDTTVDVHRNLLAIIGGAAILHMLDVDTDLRATAALSPALLIVTSNRTRIYPVA